METGCRCRPRWRIAAAAHNIRVLIGQIACQSSSLRTVNCAGDYVCPQCGNSSETRPVLNTNAALAEVVKRLKQASFSPLLPPQSYAGPEDVACDFCNEQKLKAVKCCSTCGVNLCETHIRRHYTTAALQKHILSDVTGNMKTRPSEQHQNTDNSFSSTVSGQQDQTDKTKDIIEEEARSISESALSVCTSEMEVNKDTDVRSLALLCSKLQQDVAGLKKSLSNLNEKNTKKERYFDEDEEYYGEEDEEEDDKDHDDDDDDYHDYDDDAEGYTDDEDEEEKEDSYDDEKDNIDEYNEDYDDLDYKYSEDCDDEEDSAEDDDEDEDYDEGY